jgi:hypothetical protein
MRKILTVLLLVVAAGLLAAQTSVRVGMLSGPTRRGRRNRAVNRRTVAGRCRLPPENTTVTASLFLARIRTGVGLELSCGPALSEVKSSPPGSPEKGCSPV